MNKFRSLIVKAENKRRKGFTLIEIMVACAIIIALSVGAFFFYSQAQQSRKMAQMRQDMEAITTAALAYEAMSIDSTPPADIASLITGLSADKAVDGTAHEFLTQTKGSTVSADSILDPWGTAYTYSQADRTVTCTPKDASGTDMTAVVRSF